MLPSADTMFVMGKVKVVVVEVALLLLLHHLELIPAVATWLPLFLS